MSDIANLLREAASGNPQIDISLRNRLEAAAEAMGEPVAWEYFYRVSDCPAKDGYSQDCICWHREGSGPYKSRHHGEQDTPFEWRVCRLAPQPAVPKGFVLVPVELTPDLYRAGIRAAESATEKWLPKVWDAIIYEARANALSAAAGDSHES